MDWGDVWICKLTFLSSSHSLPAKSNDILAFHGMVIWACSKIKTINKGKRGLFNCFNYIFLAEPLNFPWIYAVASLHCVSVQWCSRNSVPASTTWVQSGTAAYMQVHEDFSWPCIRKTAPLPGSHSFPDDQSPLNPSPGHLWPGSRHSGAVVRLQRETHLFGH